MGPSFVGRYYVCPCRPMPNNAPFGRSIGGEYYDGITLAMSFLTENPEGGGLRYCISYRRLLEFFFQIHDPTTLNRQGNDHGASYRPAIFYRSDEQSRIANDTITDVNASGLWPGTVVTQVAPIISGGQRLISGNSTSAPSGSDSYQSRSLSTRSTRRGNRRPGPID